MVFLSAPHHFLPDHSLGYTFIASRLCTQEKTSIFFVLSFNLFTFVFLKRSPTASVGENEVELPNPLPPLHPAPYLPAYDWFILLNLMIPIYPFVCKCHNLIISLYDIRSVRTRSTS